MHTRIHSGVRLPIVVVACVIVFVSACSGDPGANAPTAYVTSCATCHDEGLGGAPVPGDKADWERRTGKGMAKVYENAINGFEGAMGIMPARGSRPDLSDEEIKEAVDWMVQASQ